MSLPLFANHNHESSSKGKVMSMCLKMQQQASQSSQGPTSSRTGTFYFAYGSNLSPEQMAGRCVDSPTTSSTPVAIARLDGWRWIICERGYANIVPCSPVSQPHQPQLQQGPGPDNHYVQHQQQQQQQQLQPSIGSNAWFETEHQHVVWGIVYNLTSTDEAVLDEYEGHGAGRNPSPMPNPSPDPEEVRRKPFLQGRWDYNKLYLPVIVTQWLQPPQRYGLVSPALAAPPAEPGWRGHEKITVLVYVDELRTAEGPMQPQYAGRMNRAIEQGTRLGVPMEWVQRVMGRWIQPGAAVDDGYLGRRDGYWQGQDTGETGGWGRDEAAGGIGTH